MNKKDKTAFPGLFLFSDSESTSTSKKYIKIFKFRIFEKL